MHYLLSEFLWKLLHGWRTNFTASFITTISKDFMFNFFKIFRCFDFIKEYVWGGGGGLSKTNKPMQKFKFTLKFWKYVVALCLGSFEQSIAWSGFRYKNFKTDARIWKPTCNTETACRGAKPMQLCSIPMKYKQVCWVEFAPACCQSPSDLLYGRNCMLA